MGCVWSICDGEPDLLFIYAGETSARLAAADRGNPECK